MIDVCTVISPTSRSNALGRAISIADLARDAFPNVRLYAPDDGAPWQGARRSPVPVRTFARTEDIISDLGGSGPNVLVWAIKPLDTSWRTAHAVRQALPEAAVVLDIDDADEALSRQFIASSALNRLRLHPWSPLNPKRIRKALNHAMRGADGMTYASEAVKDMLEINIDRPVLRVPHPRRRTASLSAASRPASQYINLGFLGTMRSHKGASEIEVLVLANPRYRLHVFSGALPHQTQHRLQAQLVEHDVDAPMETVYSGVDVVILPQDASPAASVQLPAKLLDAMRLGKPVIASPTKAILETAADTVLYIRDWRSVDDVQSTLVKALATKVTLGQRARARFEEQLALEVHVSPLIDFACAIQRSKP